MRAEFRSIFASAVVFSLVSISSGDEKHNHIGVFPHKQSPTVNHPVDRYNENRGKLRFKSDGTFKIVQFTDTQDDQDIDPRTVATMNAVLDDQRPDLVVFTGDNIRRGPVTVSDVEKAIDNIARPVNERRIPWLITFGNHDEEVFETSGIDEEGMLDIYMSYRYNINKPSPSGVDGSGDMQVLIYNARGNTPVFNVWALDAGRYAPDSIAGQSLENLPGWDWIKASQISWYRETSKSLENTYNKKINSLMFFHIPLYEFKDMWANKERHSVIGERNEVECPGAFNSGMFTAILERGDVNGVFVGHDHVNNYVGNYMGVYLGYSANTGFGTYGLDGEESNRLRGARVFEINQNNPGNFTTHMVYAKDYGIQ